MKRIVVGISGASGSIFGVRLLESLHSITDVETHLVVSKWGQQTLEHETELTLAGVRELADHSYSAGEMGAVISSGSFHTDGMVIIPASMRTVAAIAHGFGEHLIHRAAEVILKERRKLVLVPRETPLAEIHLENLLKLARMGAVILPPDPAFYNHPKNIDDIINHIVGRVCDQLCLKTKLSVRWDGNMKGDGVVPLHPKN